MSRDAKLFVAVWVGLMTLLALTVGATFGPFGAAKPAINLTIAATKAGLILWFYMHLREQGGLTRIVALAALAWLAVLIGLTQADLVTRSLFHG